MIMTDKRTGRVGELVGREDGGYRLRPLESIGEWFVPAESARASTVSERIKAGVQIANQRSASRP